MSPFNSLVRASKAALRAVPSTKQLDCRAFSTTVRSPKYYDALIVGGGAVGCSLARLLNQELPALKVGLLEAKGGPTREVQEYPHPRSYALSPKSLEILGSSVVSRLDLGKYDSMQVWQANSPSCLTFTSRDLDADPAKTSYLGACVEDGPLVAALWDEVQSKTTCQTNTVIQSVDHLGDSGNLARVTTSAGEVIETKLLVASDGSNSFVRSKSGIPRTGFDYNQHALTFTVEIDGSLNGRAFQRFLEDGGPMALLPTRSDSHAVVVWSTSPVDAQHWKNAETSKLVEHLNESLREGPQRIPPMMESDSFPQSLASNIAYGAERVLDTLHYGLAMASHHPQPKFETPPRIKSVVGPRFVFPLSCYHADSYCKGRIVLVGDSAHTVHPMAGQGLNLGFGDVRALVDSIEKACKAGMDPMVFTAEYSSARRRDVTVSLAGIHFLQRVFGSQLLPVQHAKTLGMNLIQNFDPLRRQLAVAATQGVSL